jgi:predicted regulator of Ras-like GTPase activity (Roadblock/LC7/MglB family)
VANVFIAPLGDSLLTVLADKQVNVGRVLSEVKTVKEEI